jgi:sugar phosphate isomerase/epimerase
MRLGLVTYNLAKDWDVPTIIKNCQAAGFEGVELRTTHAHKVEPDLSAEEREKVKQAFDASKVRLVSLGSICEYHSADPAEVRRNIELTKKFVMLAHDVGAIGVKVRPNGFVRGVPESATLEQIGEALRECGKFGESYGMEIWLEVHGSGTQLPANAQAIMRHCDHGNVGVCWNSNPTDVEGGTIRKNFNLLRPWIKSCHITELWTDYPWRELFALLGEAKYERYTLAEIPESKEPDRLMKYYRALWRELGRA